MNIRRFLAVGVLMCSGAIGLHSQPIILSSAEAAKQGPALAQEILSIKPESLTNSGFLKIRDAKGKRTETLVQFRVTVGADNWQNTYMAFAAPHPNTNPIVELTIIHTDKKPNEYRLLTSDVFAKPDPPGNSAGFVYLERTNARVSVLEGNATMIPFAGSDFWVADLGLEFLHWPGQRLLRKELRRGQSCAVLESTNPHPAPGAYSRVVSWIDIDTDGIMNAEAYDSKGKVLKEFAIKSIKKVQGQPELKEMEMDNRQTGSRTWIEFDLSSGK